uniref:DoxX family protein n=1 Tax=Streptomyces sp. CHD11 TaxID=2741325 RepID=UPI0027E47F60|nr:DoxX family protein [Streptomyces sp. CHD11]
MAPRRTRAARRARCPGAEAAFGGTLGIAAAVGLTLYFAGVVAAHLRVGDHEGTPPAAVLTLIAIALIVCAPSRAERPDC